MSLRYKGSILSATPPTTSQSSAGGVWTLEQQMQAQGSSLWPPNGPFWVEDVFSTYLYTSTAATQTITNNINLSGKGGLVWLKRRDSSVQGSHWLTDTARGAGKELRSETTNAETTFNYMSAFGSSGFTDGGQYPLNATVASWTFRKAEKFFDVVTYTGTSSSFLTVNHNLGSIPGCIIVKCTTAGSSENWVVYHRSGGVYNGTLNSSASFGDGPYFDNITSTSFRLTGNSTGVSTSGRSYVAYLFAHDAGGFGTTGTDSIVKCGTFTCDGSGNATIDLGWEPQWVLLKRTDATENWEVFDNMRGFVDGTGRRLRPSLSEAESDSGEARITNTGFRRVGVGASAVYVYVAIRRQMKPAYTGTDVFKALVRTGTGANASVTSVGFSPDLLIGRTRSNSYSPAPIWATKLAGIGNYLGSSSTNGDTTNTNAMVDWLNNGYVLGPDTSLGHFNYNTSPTDDYVSWNFKRAPGFFDVVVYTGTGSNRTITHNLGVTPELLIVKSRDSVRGWMVYNAFDGGTKYAQLDQTNGWAALSSIWNNTDPTSSVFSVGTNATTNESGMRFVGYLFASVAGISKIGTYTGNGTNQTIDCGFAAGARFVMIKRRNTSGDWYVWDTARGIVASNDPRISLNTITAEYTINDSIDPDNTGFIVNQNTNTNINVSSSTYLYLAIA